MIENVGNLVCPALFDLGEQARVVLASVTEGADKPLKYPHMFRQADLVLLNKIDLLPYVDFDVRDYAAGLRKVTPDALFLQVSATTGDGMHDLVRLAAAPRPRSRRSKPRPGPAARRRQAAAPHAAALAQPRSRPPLAAARASRRPPPARSAPGCVLLAFKQLLKSFA